jgi:hypothetical protein
MPRTFPEKHRAAINRAGVLKHSEDYFREDTRRISLLHLRRHSPETLERLRVQVSGAGWIMLRRERI